MSSKATILSAILAASEGDTVLVAPGTYTGLANKNISFGGKNLTLKSTGGPEQTLIDCEGSGRGVYIHQGETNNAVIVGFSITGGNISVKSSEDGCIYGGTLVNCRIYGNHTQAEWSSSKIGGGVCRATLIDCQIYDNHVTINSGL